MMPNIYGFFDLNTFHFLKKVSVKNTSLTFCSIFHLNFNKTRGIENYVPVKWRTKRYAVFHCYMLVTCKIKAH